MVIGLVLVGLWPETVRQLSGKILSRPGTALGWGLIVLIMTPVICLLLLITLVGAPLAILLGMVWAIALMVSKIFVSVLVGQKLAERFWQAKKDSLYAALVIGVAVSYFIFAIPVIGWLLCALALLAGLGAIYLNFKKA